MSSIVSGTGTRHASAQPRKGSPERIMIMGPPGSGKSRLARKLGAARNLPVFHLDQITWMKGWQPRSVSERRAAVARIVAAPAWIFDGNDPATLACRMRHADVLVYLDAPRHITLPRLLWRMLLNFGRIRPDMAPGCPERIDLGILRSAWSWTPRRREQSTTVLRYFPGLTIMLASRRDRQIFEARYLRRR